MRSERMTSLGRRLANLQVDFVSTYASQWMERTLDDSAIRRIDIPEMFLCADALLRIMDNVFSGLVVYPKLIESRVKQGTYPPASLFRTLLTSHYRAPIHGNASRAVTLQVSD